MVDVAFVVVPLIPVKFCKVVELVTSKVEFMVVEAVEKKPFKNPTVVEVETPYEAVSNGKAKVANPEMALFRLVKEVLTFVLNVSIVSEVFVVKIVAP